MNSFCRYSITLLWALLSWAALGAQNVELSGRVTDSANGEPVPGVIVKVRRDASGGILKFASTRSDGTFSIVMTRIPEGACVEFAMMGYAPLSRPVDAEHTRFEVSLVPQEIDIREVIVTPPSVSVRGDTVAYNVSNFAQVQDKSIGDVIRRMPGVEVSKSGQISYNGEAINKLYIEGVDVAGGKYTLATNNISHKDIRSVEIMENHQPVKALRDIQFSKQAAINLRLKEEAKARWVGNLRAAAGASPALWNGSLFAMRVAGSGQSMNTYKTDNTGVNLRNELSDFSLSDFINRSSEVTLPQYIDVSPSSAPGLGDQRVRFNTTHLLTASNVKKLSEDYQLSSQVTYLYDELSSDNSSSTTYFFEDGTTSVVEQDEHASGRTHVLSARVQAMANTEKRFVTNTLSAVMEWERSRLCTRGAYANDQAASTPSYKATYDLQLVKRFGGRSLTLTSKNQFLSAPQTLTVVRDDSRQHQFVRASALVSNTSASYGWAGGGWSFTLRGGLSAWFRALNSRLSGVEGYDTPGRSALGYLNPYLRPSLEYRRGKLRLRLESPLSYYRYWSRDRVAHRSEPHDDWTATPSLYAEWSIAPRLQLSMNASAGKSPVSTARLYEGVILGNYRNLNGGLADYANDKSSRIGADLRYKDPINSFFASASAFRTWNTVAHTASRSFVGDYIVSVPLLRETDRTGWGVSGSVSKGINSLYGAVKFDISYSVAGSSMVQNEVLTPYRSSVLTLSPRFNARFAPWCMLEYELTYSRNRLRVSGGAGTSSSNSSEQSLSLSFNPVKGCSLSASGEHYYTEFASDRGKNLFMADLKASYAVGKRWEVNLSLLNIFNKKEYSYTLYDALSNYFRSYRIRPRTFLAGVYWSF